jgi:ppGpp synthetase/RelA/SpoT-type nucleotidyltranferase
MSELAETYKLNKPANDKALTQLVEELKGFFYKHRNSLDVQNIFGRVKEIGSIETKIKKYKLKEINDLDDIVGTSVICHTRTDADRAVVLLTEYLPTKYNSVTGESKNTNDGYQGHHFNFTIDVHDVPVKAEIQVKSVLQYAWSLQSHKYLYKSVKEGDADILARTVSGIFQNCENLWELVKKSGRQESDGVKTEADEIAQKVTELTERTSVAKKVVNGVFVDSILLLFKNYSPSNKVDLPDILNKEFKSAQDTWNKLYKNPATVSDAKNALEVMEPTIKQITLLGLYAIKYDNLEIFEKVLDSFGKIAGLSSHQDGLVMLLSVPGAILHNMFYYFGAYALKNENWEVLKLLIGYQMEITGRTTGETGYLNIWSTGTVMAPEILANANLTFDRLRNTYPQEDQRIKEILGLDGEQFLDLICQFNMLFCLKKKQEDENPKNSKRYTWAYPNFGRFNSQRVWPLVKKIIVKQTYEKLTTEVYGESKESFNKYAGNRLGLMVRDGVGAGYLWQSITEWS